MKLMIAGSRGITEFDLSKFVPENTDMIISGGADGVDAIAEKFADDKRISKLILRPRYDLYGKGAPLKRNEEMVDMADKVLVVWDGKSKGSAYTIKYAKIKNKDVDIVVVERK